jgi:hypothetical protein
MVGNPRRLAGWNGKQQLVVFASMQGKVQAFLIAIKPRPGYAIAPQARAYPAGLAEPREVRGKPVAQIYEGGGQAALREIASQRASWLGI